MIARERIIQDIKKKKKIVEMYLFFVTQVPVIPRAVVGVREHSFVRAIHQRIYNVVRIPEICRKNAMAIRTLLADLQCS